MTMGLALVQVFLPDLMKLTSCACPSVPTIPASVVSVSAVRCRLNFDTHDAQVRSNALGTTGSSGVPVEDCSTDERMDAPPMGNAVVPPTEAIVTPPEAEDSARPASP